MIFYIKFTRKCNFFHDLFNNKANQDEKQLMKGYTFFSAVCKRARDVFFGDHIQESRRKNKNITVN